MFKHLIAVLFAPGDALLDRILDSFEAKDATPSKWAQNVDVRLLIGSPDLALADSGCGRFDRLRGQGF